MSRGPAFHRFPMALLGLLTLVSFAGPIAMLLAVRGGPRPDWPPDRPVEWIVIGVVVGLAIVLFLACVTIGWWYPWDRMAGKPGPPSSGIGPSTRSTH